jgi:dipeptidase
LTIADPNEGFILHMLASDEYGSSAVWVAQRVPDDKITVVANMFTVRKIDFNDDYNFIYSKNIKEVALKYK